MAVTRPISIFSFSSIGPCSMCNSKKALMSSRLASAIFSGSPPTRLIASLSFSPPASVKASDSALRLPVIPRLPTQDNPYTLGSSARKSTSSISCLNLMPLSFKTRPISSAAITPATPSKRPPLGTVSECEPIMIEPAPGVVPEIFPIRFPAASCETTNPASTNLLFSHSRP